MGTKAAFDHDELDERGDELDENLLRNIPHRAPDLDVDGWEPSLLHRLRKYLDPKNK